VNFGKLWRHCVAVIVPFREPLDSFDRRFRLVAARHGTRQRQPSCPRPFLSSRMIPDVANHLISSGAAAFASMLSCDGYLAGSFGEGHVKARCSVESCTPPIAALRRVDVERIAAARQSCRLGCLWATSPAFLVRDFLLGQAFR